MNESTISADETTIYYFSGTGNSYTVAKDIQKKLKNCKLVAITDEYKKEFAVTDTQNVGIVFPLYFLSMPKIVMDFVEKINLDKSEYIFSIVTRGGSKFVGGALSHLNKILKRKEKKLSAGFYVQMPGNYILMYGAPSEKIQAKEFSNAVKKIEYIVNKVNSKEHIIEIEPFSFMRPFLHGIFIKRLKKVDSRFWVTKSCNSCGICEKVCHFQNIKNASIKPEWQHNCQACMACIQYCPMQAIQHKNSTVKKTRYHHPQVLVTKYIEI